ncbi:MAG: LysR family transcriptional regulator [Pseudomonadota bacterium]
MKRETLQSFLAVARLRSFRKSSDVLNTTQSNVSARIATLERDLGTQLFHRSGGAVQLTTAGRDLIPFARAVLESMEALETAAGAPQLERGTLRLALSESMVAVLLPRFMRAFFDRFPGANVEITVDSSANQRAKLLDRVVDVAFLMGPVSQYEVSNLPLLKLPLVWAAHRDHPLARLPHVPMDALVRFPIISYAQDSRPYTELKSALVAAGVPRPRLFSSNALNANLAMTLEQLGVATLPDVFARPHLDAGTLVALDCEIPLSALEFTASYLADGASPLAEAAAHMARAVAAGLRQSKISISDHQTNEFDAITER